MRAQGRPERGHGLGGWDWR